jgi:hypothetical protein
VATALAAAAAGQLLQGRWRRALQAGQAAQWLLV